MSDIAIVIQREGEHHNMLWLQALLRFAMLCNTPENIRHPALEGEIGNASECYVIDNS